MTNQEIWDDCLIRGWKADIPMDMLIKQVVYNIEPDLLKSSWLNSGYFPDDFDRVGYITKLEIRRRCMDRNTYGELEFSALRGCVRAFIAQRSPEISKMLFDGHSADSVLGKINTFKWTRSNLKNSNKITAVKRKNLKAKMSEVIVRKRSIKNKYTWGTVG